MKTFVLTFFLYAYHAAAAATGNFGALQSCVMSALNGTDSNDRIQTPSSSTWQDAMVGAVIKPETPAIIAFANKVYEVQALVKCATTYGYNPVPRSGRHHFEGWSALNNSLVIDVSSLSYVDVATDQQTAVIGAGTNLGWIYTKLSQYGKTFLGGICPTVALGGYMGVGGYSLQHRELGLAVDQVLQFKVVTATGDLLTVSPTSYPDLWFAARGGGVYGVVIEATVKIVTLPRSSMIMAFFPNASTRYDVIKKYLATFPSAPPALTSQLNIYTNRTQIIGWYLGGSVADMTKVAKASGIYDIPGANIYIGGNCSTENSRMFWQDTTTKCIDDPTAYANFLTVYNTQPINLSPLPPNYRIVERNALMSRPQAKPWARFGVISHTYFSQKSIGIPDAAIQYVVNQSATLPLDVEFWGEWTSMNVSNPATTSAFPWLQQAVMLMRFEVSTGTSTAAYNKNHQFMLNFDKFFRPQVGNASYAGYVDVDINTNPYLAYYGSNICKLIQVKAKYDPNNVFSNPFSIPTTPPPGISCPSSY